MRSPVMTSWHPASWHTKAAQQQPRYDDPVQLEKVVAQLSRLPPIVVSWEVDAARGRLAAAQRDRHFRHVTSGRDFRRVHRNCALPAIPFAARQTARERLWRQ